MVDGLDADTRAEVDTDLEVELWGTPKTRLPKAATVREEGAPSWWHGDEEASQSWLAGMGITLE